MRTRRDQQRSHVATIIRRCNFGPNGGAICNHTDGRVVFSFLPIYKDFHYNFTSNDLHSLIDLILARGLQFCFEYIPLFVLDWSVFKAAAESLSLLQLL
jgi:hypothetical protein